MNKEYIYTPKAPEPIGPYSQAISLGWDTQKMIYTSGQLAIDPSNGNFIDGDIKAQTTLVLENLQALLESAGSGLDKVIKTTVFLRDMNEFSEMNEIYGNFFGGSKPARSTVEVARLPKDARVEIEAIAYI
ncbi:MAG: RidA family protein [Ignavibacteria bacterium]|nr:RidA family protein [Ignavibacteria bacterium]